MKRFVLIVGIIGMIFSSNVFAQNWNAEQKEILERVKTGWTLWQKALLNKDLSIWLDGFEPSEDFQGWWVSDGALWNLDADKRTFDDYVRRIKGFYWETIHPLSIRVFDDVALIYFYVTFNEQDQNGTWSRVENKRLEIYRKQGGKWRWTDGMVAGKQIGLFIEDK